MAKSMPSMVALLGLLAVAGYQNRDKLGSVLGGLGNAGKAGNGGSLGSAGAGGLGSILSGGLGGLLDHFSGNGAGAKAQSWVNTGANEQIGTDELERTLGPETLAALQQQTGLDRQELLDRLARTLPEAVDRLTPEGRLPTESEAARFADVR